MSGRARGSGINEDADALRLLTREAHEATKDLRSAIREVRKAIDDAEETRTRIVATAAYAVGEGIDVAVAEGLQSYANAIKKAIDDAEQAVYDRFDVIAATLLGETQEQRDAGEIPAIDQASLIRKIVRGVSPDALTEEELKAARAMRDQRSNQ